MECRECFDDEVVFIDGSYDRKEEFFSIPSILPCLGTCIAEKYEYNTKSSKYDEKNIVVEKVTQSDERLRREREISGETTDDRHELRDDIDHHHEKCEHHKKENDERIGHRAHDLTTQTFFISHIICQCEKCFREESGALTTFDDSDLPFFEKIRKFSHRDIDRVTSLDKENQVINDFLEFGCIESIMETMESGEECYSSLEEIGDTLIKECFISDGKV